MSFNKRLRSFASLLRGLALPPDLRALITQVRAQNLSYLSKANLIDIAESILALKKQGVEGSFIEAGVALGGSAAVIAKAKPSSTPLALYDTFAMIPEPSDEDGSDVKQRYQTIQSGQATGIGGDPYYGYEKDLLKKVKGTLSAFGIHAETQQVQFIKGLFSDTMQIDQPVCFAHIDCDWYDSVMLCLQRIVPNLVKGGVLVIDDYEDWSGCRKAVDDYLAENAETYSLKKVWKSKLHLVKTA